MRNLSRNGLSMSQAQTISNLCNQRATEIQRELDSYNNCSKTITIDGKEHLVVEPSPIPGDFLSKLKLKASLHACQAFLMEALKSKDAEINRLKHAQVDISHLEIPKREYIEDFDILDNVEESWGWQQLTDTEYSEYLDAEAMAAHLGQFIHKNGVLSNLRKELPGIPTIEWFEVETGKKTPVMVTKHHTSDQLMDVHETIAKEHKIYEQRVNYYKAKVKNLVSDENARIQKYNADRAAEQIKLEQEVEAKYEAARNAYTGEVVRLKMEFNAKREQDIKATAALRINVDPRFQPVIDMFNTPEK
jgi:hypothetical protein